LVVTHQAQSSFLHHTLCCVLATWRTSQHQDRTPSPVGGESNVGRWAWGNPALATKPRKESFKIVRLRPPPSGKPEPFSAHSLAESLLLLISWEDSPALRSASRWVELHSMIHATNHPAAQANRCGLPDECSFEYVDRHRLISLSCLKLLVYYKKGQVSDQLDRAQCKACNRINQLWPELKVLNAGNPSFAQQCAEHT
jgi:hypothetical protein